MAQKKIFSKLHQNWGKPNLLLGEDGLLYIKDNSSSEPRLFDWEKYEYENFIKPFEERIKQLEQEHNELIVLKKKKRIRELYYDRTPYFVPIEEVMRVCNKISEMISQYFNDKEEQKEKKYFHEKSENDYYVSHKIPRYVKEKMNQRLKGHKQRKEKKHGKLKILNDRVIKMNRLQDETEILDYEQDHHVQDPFYWYPASYWSDDDYYDNYYFSFSRSTNHQYDNRNSSDSDSSGFF